MSTITKERVTGIASGEKCYTHDDVVELARIALASLEAEPVAYVDPFAFNNFSVYRAGETDNKRMGREWMWANPDAGLIPVYTAPPAPVLTVEISDIIKRFQYQADHLSDWHHIDEHSCKVNRRDLMTVLEFMTSCRAAMLQGDDGTLTNEGAIPANTPCKDAPEHIWLQTAGVWPENGEFSELTWCSDNQHPNDTLYVRADVVTGNSPVIPDGWVACSERLPPQGKPLLVCSSGGVVQRTVYGFDGENWLDWYEQYDPVKSELGDSWMPLPAAPQQEVKP
ncbi:TPA: DUF551 domain-containing protein [Enterobacter asburiae]